MDEDMRRAVIFLRRGYNQLIKAREAISTDKKLWDEVDTLAGEVDDTIARWKREHDG
jgi:hypothetical protein